MGRKKYPLGRGMDLKLHQWGFSFGFAGLRNKPLVSHQARGWLKRCCENAAQNAAQSSSCEAYCGLEKSFTGSASHPWMWQLSH